MGNLILIDGNAILHRAYHALPPLTTKKGEPINAVYGLISMLLRVISDLKPAHIAVCFDEKEPTFRHEHYESYQAQRPPMADELSGQFTKAKKTVEAFQIPIYSKAGYEADDVLATLAKQAANKIEEVIIVTGDRDILQLVNKKIKVYLPILGLSNAKLMGEKEVFEKIGVKPTQIADYKALVGDSSDNYPGVTGIGPKTAIGLLSKYENLEGIYKNLNKLPVSARNKLEKGRKEAKFFQKLAKIVDDAPVKLDIKAASGWDVDNQKVLDLFAEFGFKTLTERVKKVGAQIDNEKQGTLFDN